jgi:hypothetical protein
MIAATGREKRRTARASGRVARYLERTEPSRRTQMLRQSTIGTVLLASVAMAGGCLVTSGRSIDESGVRVSSDTLRQIEPGVTTEAWLVATLGEPSERTTVEDQEHVEILRYDHTVSKSEGGTVFLLFAGSSETRKTTRTFFEVTEGVVTRYWNER